MGVTDDEQWDMVQGNNVAFDIKQAFIDPQTGEFQRDRVISYLQQVNQQEIEKKYKRLNNVEEIQEILLNMSIL